MPCHAMSPTKWYFLPLLRKRMEIKNGGKLNKTLITKQTQIHGPFLHAISVKSNRIFFFFHFCVSLFHGEATSKRQHFSPQSLFLQPLSSNGNTLYLPFLYFEFVFMKNDWFIYPFCLQRFCFKNGVLGTTQVLSFSSNKGFLSWTFLFFWFQFHIKTQ
jgi:hypothetical protein